MRIHVQDGRTRKYLHGVNTWVAGISQARNFANSIDAFRHCVDQGFSDVNIVVDLGARREPLVIPVGCGAPATTQVAAVATPAV